MEQYKTNQIISKKIEFRSIEKCFLNDISQNTPNNNLIKHNSHLNLSKRPELKKKNNIILDKNPLDQIGNDDLIFSNDKLITNIKLDNLDDFSPRNSIIDDSNKTINKSLIFKNRRKRSLTPEQERTIKRNIQKNNLNKSNERDNFNLNCNKMQYKNKTNGKGSSNKNVKKDKNYNQSNPIKNINQFINKPSKCNNNNKNILMTPINKKTSSKISCHNSFSKLRFNPKDIHNDSISLASVSRLGTRSCIRGGSMQHSMKNKSNIHLPNKSVIKNKDKLFNELQKIFGEKIQLYDDLYQSMTDLDKKNCINFLLEAIKEFYNLNKITQSKNDVYKELNENKDKQIKDYKNQIKELKKDIIKLNKIVKTNIQLNKKLSQNIENLKVQLVKEKNKNKDKQNRGKSMDTKHSNIKYRNDINGINNSTTKKKRNRSQDKFNKTIDFSNQKKVRNTQKSNDKIDINERNNKTIDINERNNKTIDINERNNKTIDINVNINNIKMEENTINSNEDNNIKNNLEKEITKDNNLNNLNT